MYAIHLDKRFERIPSIYDELERCLDDLALDLSANYELVRRGPMVSLCSFNNGRSGVCALFYAQRLDQAEY